MADLREANDQVQSKAGEVASLENQLHRAQEQLKAARAESSELLAALAAAVPRSELEAARIRAAESEAGALAAREGLQERLKEWELESTKYQATLQVDSAVARFLRHSCLNCRFVPCATRKGSGHDVLRFHFSGNGATI